MTARSDYYDDMRTLAHEKREKHDVVTSSLNLNTVAAIYRKEVIRIDRRPLKSPRIRAAYFCEDGDCSVLVKSTLPREPKIFALVHELKHHYRDRVKIERCEIRCGDYNAHELIEKGAEVFAAEFIYPENEMRTLAAQLGLRIGRCTPEDICRFKKECPAPISFQFILKRFERFGFFAKGAYASVQFKNLFESLYPPIYKQPWFQSMRQRRRPKRS